MLWWRKIALAKRLESVRLVCKSVARIAGDEPNTSQQQCSRESKLEGFHVLGAIYVFIVQQSTMVVDETPVAMFANAWNWLPIKQLIEAIFSQTQLRAKPAFQQIRRT